MKCRCGWRLDDCHREQTRDGDAGNHETRLDDRISDVRENMAQAAGMCALAAAVGNREAVTQAYAAFDELVTEFGYLIGVG
jgi:hypothetical protein